MGWGMPLEWIAGIVGLGIPTLLGVIHLRGGSAVIPLDRDAIQRALATEDLGEPREVVLGPEGHLALALTDLGPCVVWSMGGHIAARAVPPEQVELSGDRLWLRMHDPAFPDRALPVGDTTAERIRTLMGGVDA